MNQKATDSQLEDLLEKSPPEKIVLTDEDIKWLNLSPVGKEVIEDEPGQDYSECE